MKNREEQVIALAGMLQSAALVRDIGRSGHCEETAFQASILSLYDLTPPDVLSVYGGLPGIRYGLEQLKMLFQKEPQKEKDASRYLVSLIHLERKISASPLLVNAIQKGINEAEKKATFFAKMDPNMIGFFADLYFRNISSLRYRIQVVGDRRHLAPLENLKKIRALFLAGIRSTVLWRQVGGSRLQLIFGQKSLLETTNALLKKLDSV